MSGGFNNIKMTTAEQRQKFEEREKQKSIDNFHKIIYQRKYYDKSIKNSNKNISS